MPLTTAAARRSSSERTLVVLVAMGSMFLLIDMVSPYIDPADNAANFLSVCPIFTNFRCQAAAGVYCRYSHWCAARPLVIASLASFIFSILYLAYESRPGGRNATLRPETTPPGHNSEVLEVEDASNLDEPSLVEPIDKRVHSDVSVDEETMLETITVALAPLAAHAANIKISTPPRSEIPAPLMPNSIRLHRRRLTASPSGLTRHNKFKIQHRRSLSEIKPLQHTPGEQLAGGRYKLRSKAKMTKLQKEVVRRDQEDKKRCLRAEKHGCHGIAGGRRGMSSKNGDMH